MTRGPGKGDSTRPPAPQVEVTIRSLTLDGVDVPEGADIAARLETALNALVAAGPGRRARFCDGHSARLCPPLRIEVGAEQDLDAVIARAARHIYVSNFQPVWPRPGRWADRFGEAGDD